MPYFIPILFILFLGMADIAQAQEGPPKLKMGDPWEMLYGGSGCHEWPCETCTTLTERYENGAKHYKEYGAGSMRLDIRWCDVEKVRGTYDWTEPDASIIPVAKTGIHILLNIATTPEWSWANPETAATLKTRKEDNFAGYLPHDSKYWPEYEKYMTEAVKRYKDYVKHYEIWGKPEGMTEYIRKRNTGDMSMDNLNNVDPVWYAELVKRSSQIIKSIDSEARIGAGTFAKTDLKNISFLEEFYKQGIQRYYDAISMPLNREGPAVHGHPFDRDWIARVREFMTSNGDGDKPLWINEFSVPGEGMQQAFEIRRRLRLLRDTPYISVSQPLFFTAIYENRWALIAHKKMSEEWKPRSEFIAGFEEPPQQLFENWEWDIDCGPGISASVDEVYPKSGSRCFKAVTPNDYARVWIQPYVNCDKPVFSGWYRIEPEEATATFTLSIGIESGDILQDIKTIDPWRETSAAPEWAYFEFDVDENLPEWKDLATICAYLHVRSSSRLGFTLTVDDLRFGPRAAANGNQKAPAGVP